MNEKVIVKCYRLILVGFIAANLIFHLAILWESRYRIAAGFGDFIIFYTGAQIVNDGKSEELYKVDTQNAYQSKFDIPQLAWPLPYNHAPYELIPFLPLARLSYPVAHAIWSSLNLLLLVIMLRWFLGYVQSPHAYLVVALLFVWFPTMETFRLGQDSILSMGLLLAVFVALKGKRDLWAGFFLALGLYKPQLVLPLAGVFVFESRWQSVLTFSITGAVLVGLSLLMVGVGGAFDFVSMLRSMGDYTFIIFPPNMPNVRGLSTLLLRWQGADLTIGAVTLGVSIALYCFCLYCWRQKSDVQDPLFDLKFSLTLVTTVLISYHLYAHDLFPITLSLALLFRYLNSNEPTHWATFQGYYFLLILLFVPFVPRYLIYLRLFGWGSMPILLLYALLALEILRRQRLLPGKIQV